MNIKPIRTAADYETVLRRIEATLPQLIKLRCVFPSRSTPETELASANIPEITTGNLYPHWPRRYLGRSDGHCRVQASKLSWTQRGRSPNSSLDSRQRSIPRT